MEKNAMRQTEELTRAAQAALAAVNAGRVADADIPDELVDTLWRVAGQKPDPANDTEEAKTHAA